MLLTGEFIAVTWQSGLFHLVQEIAHGNKLALDQLYARCDRPVKDYLRAKFGGSIDEFEIDAIFIDAMHRVWQKGGTLRGDTDEKTRRWIMRIARNMTIDHLRYKKRTNEVETELDEERLSPLSMRNLIDVERPDLKTLFGFLTEKEKEVADLLCKGYSFSDVSKVLHISRPRVFQIKEQIKMKIIKLFGNEKLG